MDRASRADERGIALTELVITAPLILFILVAVFSLAEAGRKKALVVRAAGAAARVAVVRPDLAPAEALDVLKASDSRIKTADVKTTIAAANISRLPFSNPTRVTVTLKYHPITGFGWRPVFNLKSEFVLDRWVNGVWFDIPEAPK
ncbi:MAG: hypothetical protein Q8L35_01715 [Actinomycetota bacterium]|nr:hypothetical protein [Actinomycetota bacterium]